MEIKECLPNLQVVPREFVTGPKANATTQSIRVHEPGRLKVTMWLLPVDGWWSQDYDYLKTLLYGKHFR
jgi:hypothetical protein